VQVLVRVRPPLSGNRDGASDGPTPPVDVDGEVITIRAPKRSYRAEFDRVFDRYSTQSEVFASVQDCIGSTLDGFNATLFAFGQTGSGKTHTLFGPPTTHDHFFGVTPEAGVAPRVIDSIFGEISARQRARRELHESGPGGSQAATTSVYLSFLQVYNERVYDLLFEDSDADAPILRVHEDAERGIFVEGISQFAVTSKDECMLLLRTGVANRVVRETRMNEHSSRSHSVFQLLIEQKFGGGILRLAQPRVLQRRHALWPIRNPAGAERIRSRSSAPPQRPIRAHAQALLGCSTQRCACRNPPFQQTRGSIRDPLSPAVRQAASDLPFAAPLR